MFFAEEEVNGVTQIVIAHEFQNAGKAELFYKKFVCPFCHERVILRLGSERCAHFAHEKKTPNTPLCEKRATVYGKTIASVSSAPLFIKKLPGSSNLYQLRIGFPKLGETLLTLAEKNGYVVSIYANSTQNSFSLKVSPRNFLAEEITTVPIESVPSADSNWSIHWERSGSLDIGLYLKWSDYCTGFSSYCNPVFSLSDNSKRIQEGNSLFLDHPYLIIDWSELLANSLLSKYLSKEGKIILNHSQYHVFRLFLPLSLANSVQLFSKLKEIVQQKLNLDLTDPRLEKKLLWPPTVVNRNVMEPIKNVPIYISLGSYQNENEVKASSANAVVDISPLNNRTIATVIPRSDPFLSLGNHRRSESGNEFQVAFSRNNEVTGITIRIANLHRPLVRNFYPMGFYDKNDILLSFPQEPNCSKLIKQVTAFCAYDILFIDDNWSIKKYTMARLGDKKIEFDRKNTRQIWICLDNAIIERLYFPKDTGSDLDLELKTDLIKTPFWVNKIYKKTGNDKYADLHQKLKECISSGLISVHLLFILKKIEKNME